jgi:hypothetical protein
MQINHNTSLTTRQKALQLNLDKRIYGSFAEIGAGQEVAAQFFNLVEPAVPLQRPCLLMT